MGEIENLSIRCFVSFCFFVKYYNLEFQTNFKYFSAIYVAF